MVNLTASQDTTVARLLENRLAPAPMGELAEPPASEDDAYAVQVALATALTEAGWGAIAGYKIGCTTPVMQTFLAIDHPCAGHIHAKNVHVSPATLAFASFRRVGVECEIAVRLSRDVGGTVLDRTTAASYVDSYMAAIEVVDARYADYGSLSTPTLIADDFFQSAVVLGPPVKAAQVGAGDDLAARSGRMSVNGEIIGHGTAKDILAHPLNALVWLSELLTRRRAVAKAGQVVMLGSIVPTQWLADESGRALANQVEVQVDVEGLGSATVQFQASEA